MTVYPILLLCVVPAPFLLYAALGLRRADRRRAAAAAVSFPLCVILGFAFAKLSYVILLEAGSILEWGEWDALFSLQPRHFCFTGGACGVCLGVLLAARMTGYRPAASGLDWFVVPGALLIAGLRLAEAALGNLGAGRYLDLPDGSPLRLLAMINSYGEPHLAVYRLEALAALAVAALSLTDRKRRPGLRFELAVFRLCACQILLENLRSQALMWGFVRVEQVLCAVIMMSLTLLNCRRKSGGKGASRFLPAAGLLACFAAIVGVEFLRQRSPSRFMGLYGGFMMMAAVLAVALLIFRSVAVGRRRRT